MMTVPTRRRTLGWSSVVAVLVVVAVVAHRFPRTLTRHAGWVGYVKDGVTMAAFMDD